MTETVLRDSDLRLSRDGHREDLESVLGGQVGELLLLIERQAGRLALADDDDCAPDAGAGIVQSLGCVGGLISCLTTFHLFVYLERLHDAAPHAAAVLGRKVELVLDVNDHAVPVLFGL